MENKNVYQKLTEARKQMLETELKKSAKNNFANFKYMELTDIIPVSEKISQNVGISIITTFTDNQAITKVVNNDKIDEVIEFTSPFNINLGTGQIKGAQGVGALHTYFRRYMLMLVFEIMEHDAIDSQDPKEAQKEQEKINNARNEFMNYFNRYNSDDVVAELNNNIIKGRDKTKFSADDWVVALSQLKKYVNDKGQKKQDDGFVDKKQIIGSLFESNELEQSIVEGIHHDEGNR